MVQVYALVATAVLAGLAGFQAALIAGAPFGHLAWGGQHRVLPRKLRIGSVVSIALYAVFAYIALARAEVAEPLVGQTFTEVAAWVLTAYFAVGVVMNGISRSRQERLVMTPTVLALALLYLGLSLS
ncbi:MULTISPECIES: hypothetical protein [unclassified Arthrobacter]|uniref:hypothetical protein n=1 Tax=unclassified Arthrobacter TaxID=235627 RepID=UPI003393A413